MLNYQGHFRVTQGHFQVTIYRPLSLITCPLLSSLQKCEVNLRTGPV